MCAWVQTATAPLFNFNKTNIIINVHQAKETECIGVIVHIQED